MRGAPEKIIDLTIDTLGPKGDGIAHSQGKRIYVDRALPGDRIKARLTRDEDGLFRADIMRIATPSRDRVNPPCKLYDSCGGCTLQHASTHFYRHYKTSLLKDALEKQGLRVKNILEPVFIGPGTRRRATFAAFKTSKGVMMGYYRRRSRHITEIDECLIADPDLLAMRETLKPYLEKILRPTKPTDIFLQKMGGRFDMVITGDIGTQKQPDLNCRQILADLANNTAIARISWRGRERDELETIVAKAPITAHFGGLAVNLPPAAFLQPTPDGEAALVAAVMKALPEKGKFADLFSGCGTFTGPMLSRGSVDAFESVTPAINALNKAKGALPLTATKRDLFRNPLKREELNRYSAVVFDPPRAGAEAQARTMASSKCPLIIGVSCNPATFARDARILVQGGYRLKSVQLVDQFTWSHHAEIIGVFTK